MRTQGTLQLKSSLGAVDLGSSGAPRIRIINMALHPLKSALIVHYQQEKSEEKKIIPVEVARSMDVRAVALGLRDEHAAYLKGAPLSTVERLVKELQARRFGGDSGANGESAWGSTSDIGRSISSLDGAMLQPVDVSINRLDEYMEAMYEDIPQKIQALRSVAMLARDYGTMRVLVEHDSFLSVVTRVLNDDGKRSLDLSLSIFSIFYCISNFPDYHDQLTGNKAGDSCFRAIEREITRFQVWCDDARRRDTGVPLSAVPSGSGKAGDDSRKLLSMARKQDRVLMLAFSILTNLSFNLAVEVKMVKRGIVDLIAATFEIQSTRNKVLFSGVARSALVWGDELTIVLLDLLKKLSIFQENRSKLCENADDVLNYLLRIIAQQNDQPMIVQTAISVLCNLLHDPTMRIHVRAHQDLLPRVISLMQESHGDIHDGIVRMLYLVSCDALVNEELTHTEAIPAAMRLILEHKESRHPQDLIALVCNLACHPHGADIICGEPAEDTNDGGGIGLRLLLKRALKTGDPLLWKLIRTLATTSTSARASFLPFIDDLGKMFMVVHGNSIGNARNSASADDSLALMADLLGIFSCLASLEDFDYVQLNSSFKLLDACSVHLLNALHPSSTRAIGSSSTDALPLPATIHPDDDVALECVLLIGSMLSADNQMPSVLASYQCRDMSTSRGVTLLQLLVRLLIAKPEDQEFTLQVLHVLYLCLVADATREALLGDSPHIASYLLEIRSSDGDARGGTVPYILEIRTLADNCLDIIMDDNAHRVGAGRDTALLSLDIQQQRFLRNNAHWLERAGVSVDAE